jgi:hypothetical protein
MLYLLCNAERRQVQAISTPTFIEKGRTIESKNRSIPLELLHTRNGFKLHDSH